MLVNCVPSRSADVTTARVPWEPFYWVRASTKSAEFNNAGMFFRLQVSPTGVRSVVQLDLAGSGTMPHGFPPPSPDARAIPKLHLGQLYGLLGSLPTLTLIGAGGDSQLTHWKEREIGTVGLLNYLNDILVLDLPNRRLAVLPPTSLWETLLGHSLTTVSMERGYLAQVVLPLADATGRRYHALLDSGLSPFAVWTTEAIWQHLTGRAGPGAGARLYRFPNPSGELLFVGAQARRPLYLGSRRFPTAEIVYLDRGPFGARLEEWAQPVDMVLGTSLFSRNTVIVINLRARRVGFAERIRP